MVYTVSYIIVLNTRCSTLDTSSTSIQCLASSIQYWCGTSPSSAACAHWPAWPPVNRALNSTSQHSYPQHFTPPSPQLSPILYFHLQYLKEKIGCLSVSESHFFNQRALKPVSRGLSARRTKSPLGSSVVS